MKERERKRQRTRGRQGTSIGIIGKTIDKKRDGGGRMEESIGREGRKKERKG